MNTKILIVDDDPINISILEEIFEESAQLATAEDGETALRIVDTFLPDIILLDIMMPGLNGFETCAELKARVTTKHIPIIFLSAKNSLEDKIQGFDCGGADYVTKPFEAEEVIARVSTHLQLLKARQLIKQQNDNLELLLETRTQELIQSERNAAFSLMVKGIIHNLRGPLTAVIGLSDVICESAKRHIDRYKDPALIPTETLVDILQNTEENAELIHSAANELNTMISSLMSRSRSDKLTHIEQVDLNTLVEHELKFLNGNMCFKHKTQKTIELHPHPLPICVVAAELSQCFQNLVHNALDAIYAQPLKLLHISTKQEESWAVLSVEDNGPGIPPDQRKLILDPFYTTKPRIAKKPDEPTGTGLGLYTVSNIITSFEGRIEISDSKLGGAAVTLYLPLDET